MTGFIDPLEMNSARTEEAVTTGVEAVGQDTLDQVRELVLRAHPEVVPELVRGASLSELLASVEPAHQAYAELAARLLPDSAVPAPPTIQAPAGGFGPAPLDLDRIPTAEKLRRGIRDRISQPLR